MGPTLIEDRTDERSDPSLKREPRGVRQRLWGAVTRFAEQFSDAVARVFAPARTRASERTRRGGDTKRTGSRDAVAIRPSGQARLEGGPAGPRTARSRNREEEPETAARITDEHLRVYDTENADAYVTSDVYERVTR